MRTSALLALVPSLATLLVVGCGSSDGVATIAPPLPPAVATDPAEPAPPELPANNPPAPPPAPICATVQGTYEATREPSNVLFLLDRSGSMKIVLSTGETRWDATKKGLFDMMGTLPPTTQAGAMMFPQGDAPVTFCSIDASNEVYCAPGPARPPKAPRCTASTYQVGVANGALGASQVNAIKSYVGTADNEFYYGTPMAAALTAAIGAQRASTIPGAKSVILLTDGDPTDCHTTADPNANDIGRVVAAASDGATVSPGKALVRTFVMGVIDGTKGATAENLSPVAKAGGTGRFATCDATNDCFYAINAATFQADVAKAFAEISLQAFDCTFNVPPGNAMTDPTKVNVTLTSSVGTQTLAQDINHQNGWDYLPSGSQIQLYGAACSDMKSDPAAKVDIVVGCKTVVKSAPPPPR